MFDVKKGVDILSIDAKDLFIASEYLDKDNGYNIRYLNGTKKGEINTSKFINKLDYSLELLKLIEVYEKKYRSKKFTFEKNSHHFTTRIINVNFEFNIKEFNKIGKHTYVKLDFNKGNKKTKDCVIIENNELKVIELLKEVNSPIDKSLLGNNFEYDTLNKYYKLKSNKVIYTTSYLRNELYKNGFICDGVEYVRFKRSSGSSRIGKCLFIDKKLYPMMHKWEMCGLKFRKDKRIDLAALEAYISLTLSSIIDTIEIDKSNILVVDDYESVFLDDVIETRLIDGKLHTSEATTEIRNSIWDGQSLLDISLFGDYKSKGMLLLRNNFFKSCCFNTNIQKFFEDNNITSVDQLNGKTVATDIKQIKLITTPSSIKYLKFGTLEEWLNNIDTIFGIVKYEKPTHFFDGRMVKTHYQLLNTIQLTPKDIHDFLSPSLDYITMIKEDPSILRFHIKYPDEIIFEDKPLNSKNDIVYKLLGINNEFSKTKIYDDFKKDLTKAYIKNLRKGHVYTKGNYSTMMGNGYEMLKQSINTFDGSSILDKNSICSINFEDCKKILGSRSPHVTIGNVWITKNIHNETIFKYFNLTNEIVYINSINENILQRLSGSDFDSDTVLLTDNEILIRAAEVNYNIFKVPTNNVESKKTSRKYTYEELSDLDISTSNNKIGEIIDFSQDLNTKLWDIYNSTHNYKDIEELYYDICQLDVMSNIEIDKAKKEFDLDMNVEIATLRDKWKNIDDNKKTIKPNFFSFISKYKGYYNPKKNNYQHHKSSMDYLEREINKYQRKRVDSKINNFMSFYSILKSDDYDASLINKSQATKVINEVINLKTKSNILFSKDYLSSETKREFYNQYRQESINYIGNINMNKHTIIFILKKIDNEKYRNIYNTVFKILFGHPNTSFFKMINESKEHINSIEECINGDIEIFNIHYIKK